LRYRFAGLPGQPHRTLTKSASNFLRVSHRRLLSLKRISPHCEGKLTVYWPGLMPATATATAATATAVAAATATAAMSVG
jgi:hypothetical protein